MSSFNKYRLKGAYHYEWYKTEPWYKECVDRCVEFCKGSTLDVGCGDGVLSKLISERGYHVLGIDPDPDAIKLAIEHAPKAQLGNISARPFDTLWFDYLACLNVIEHMDNPGVLKDIIKRNITKGAIIITNEYQGGALGEDHKHEYSYDELLDFFKEFNPTGFKIEPEWIGVKIKC